tara:strand:- start:21254 stop:21823 length:570 start_codon:yes stop_codon:yes gene_type:complete
MWKSTLLDDLAFYSKQPTPANPGVPTWSWASCRDGVDFLCPDEVHTAELVHLDFEYDGAVQLGASLAASIRLKGPTLYSNAATLTHKSSSVPLVDDGVCTLVGLDDCGLRAMLGTESQLLLMVLSTSLSPRKHAKVVRGVAIILHEISTGKLVKVGAERLKFSKLGVTDNEELMEAFLSLFTEREVDIF